ncbi:MAG: TolC family protein [Bacteroidetes bacterium]|nr:TolC family protein [Bacteroidota bacterium]
MKKIVFSLMALIFSATAFGQEIVSISKSALENKSLDKNLQVQLAEKEIQLAQAELLGSRAAYLPNITASYTYMNTNSPLMAFGTKLNQARISMMDFNPDQLNNPKAINNFNTKIEVLQPIINRDAVYMKKAGQVKADVLKIKSERTKEYLHFELKKAYMMLQLAYKMQETLQNAKATTLANKKVIDNYFKNGIIQKSDVLYMDVRISEIDSQLQVAKSNIQNASDYLYFLMNENAEGKILKPTENLEYQEIFSASDTKINENRKDIAAYQKSLDAYDYLIKAENSKFLPRLNAFGTFEMNDKKFASFDANGYMAGVQLSWNVFDGLKSKSEKEKYKAEIEKTKAQIEAYTQQSQLELNKAYTQIQDADAKVHFTQQAWEQSKEAYRIRKNRYDQGLEKSADLLTAETLMSQKELEMQQAIFEYNTAVEHFKFLKN